MRSFKIKASAGTKHSGRPTKKQFSVKASKSDKKKFSIKSSSVKSAYGYWDDEANGENYRKILHTLYENIFNEYDGKVIDGVELSITDHWTTRTPGAYKFDITFLAPDYTKDTMLEVISDPKLRNKFLCRVSHEPFKYDEQFEIRQSGSKQIIIDKINEIVSRLGGDVKASVIKKRQQAVKASDLGNSRPLTKYTERQVLDAMNVLGYHPWGPIPSRGAIQFSNGMGVSSFKDWKAIEEELDHILENGVGRGYTAEEQEWIPEVLEDILVYGKRWDDKYRGAEYEVDASTKTVKASKSAKRRKAIKAADDDWEGTEEDIQDMMSFEYTGGRDDDLLEYVDSFLHEDRSGAWLNTDYVRYNSPDDWEVDASLSPEAVESDFWFFLDDMDHDLYEEMLDADLANPLDEDPVNYTYNQNAINGNEFYIQLYPGNRQISAPQIDFDDRYLTPEWLKRLTEIRKAYEESRIKAYTDFQNGLGSFLANGITASTNIKCAKSLNLNARNNWDEWVLYGYDINGADVDTRVIDFQDNVRDAAGELFAWPEVDTVDLYKRGPADYDGEYFNTITRADYEASDIEASTDIFSKIDIGNKVNYSDNPIYELSGYVRMLSDEVQKHIDDDIAVTVSDEAITFTKDGGVIYIQPTEEIIPEPDDLESDAEELATAVESVLYDKAMREDFDSAWDATYDEDYATRAVEFSTDDDDLEPITGTASAEDRIFDIITDKLRSSELAEFGDVDLLNGDADIKIHSNGADLDYIIAFVGDPTTIDFENRFMKYVKNPNYNDLNADSITNLATEIVVEDGMIKSVYFVNLDDNDLTNYDITAYEDFIRKMAEPTVSEIYNFIDEVVNDGSI